MARLGAGGAEALHREVDVEVAAAVRRDRSQLGGAAAPGGAGPRAVEQDPRRQAAGVAAQALIRREGQIGEERERRAGLVAQGRLERPLVELADLRRDVAELGVAALELRAPDRPRPALRRSPQWLAAR
jgi:hypothetical protein